MSENLSGHLTGFLSGNLNGWAEKRWQDAAAAWLEAAGAASVSAVPTDPKLASLALPAAGYHDSAKFLELGAQEVPETPRHATPAKSSLADAEGEAVLEDADLATAAEAERKRKAEADAREEEAAKRAKTEAAEQKKAEVAAKAATEAQAAGSRGDQSPPGELVNVVSAPPCELRLAPEPCAPGVSAGARVLVACSTGPANKKLSKQLVLAKWPDHLKLSSRVEVGPAFELHPKSIVFSKETQACLPL